MLVGGGVCIEPADRIAGSVAWSSPRLCCVGVWFDTGGPLRFLGMDDDKESSLESSTDGKGRLGFDDVR